LARPHRVAASAADGRPGGAVHLPGRTWRDRPQIDQGNGVFLAGDWVAAPGLLSEPAFSSAVTAAKKAADLLRSQSGRRGAPLLARPNQFERR
jgi:hypothetical protein